VTNGAAERPRTLARRRHRRDRDPAAARTRLGESGVRVTADSCHPALPSDRDSDRHAPTFAAPPGPGWHWHPARRRAPPRGRGRPRAAAIRPAGRRPCVLDLRGAEHDSDPDRSWVRTLPGPGASRVPWHSPSESRSASAGPSPSPAGLLPADSDPRAPPSHLSPLDCGHADRDGGCCLRHMAGAGYGTRWQGLVTAHAGRGWLWHTLAGAG
jgi:hypothetical protein